LKEVVASPRVSWRQLAEGLPTVVLLTSKSTYEHISVFRPPTVVNPVLLCSVKDGTQIVTSLFRPSPPETLVGGPFVPVLKEGLPERRKGPQQGQRSDDDNAREERDSAAVLGPWHW